MTVAYLQKFSFYLEFHKKRPFFWNGTKLRGQFVDLRPEWIDKKRSFRARALF